MEQENILINLYIHHALLTKPNDEMLLSSWRKQLQAYRQSHDILPINRLLATALLLILTKDPEKSLRQEFAAQLLDRQCDKQLVNSILAILALTENNHALYEVCEQAHNIEDFIKEIRMSISVNQAWLVLAPFEKYYAAKNYFPLVMKYNEVFVKGSEYFMNNLNNYFNFIHALLKILPKSNSFWKQPFKISFLLAQLSAIKNGQLFSGLINLINTLITYTSDEVIEKMVTEMQEMSDNCTMRESIHAAKGLRKLITDTDCVNWLKADFYSQLQWGERPNDSNWSLAEVVLSKLESERVIQEAVSYLLQFFKKSNFSLGHRVYPMLMDLLAKVKKDGFRHKIIDQLYFSNGQMADAYVLFYDPHLHKLYTLGSLFTEEKAVSYLNDLQSADLTKHRHARMMVMLCKQLRSQQTIKAWLTIVDEKIANAAPHGAGYSLYLECYAVLLVAVEEKDASLIQSYLDKLYAWFFFDTHLVSNLLLLLPYATEQQSIKWIDYFFKELSRGSDIDPMLLIKGLMTLLPLMPSPKLVQKYSMRLQASLAAHADVFFKLQSKLPADFSQEVISIILSEKEDQPQLASLQHYVRDIDQIKAKGILRSPSTA
ncbi:MAG: hypothetical protein EPO11_04345 [Gammaproteobacteria bacterium]|nr:MAG: hypothetical protein EPO11_04345 [Gammaproteobacteria bacterium]